MKQTRWCALALAAGFACGRVALGQSRPGWLTAYAHMPAVTQVVRLANADFEAGDTPTGWQANLNAAVDTAEHHGGLRSLRVTNPGPDGEFYPHVTHRIPVRPLADYTVRGFAKSVGLTDLEKKRDPPGARLIIQYDDLERKWFNVGVETSRLKPDGEWHCLETVRTSMGSSLTAPVGAAYATIFISLCANGTVWFDDIEVTEVVRELGLREPADGACLRDNTPAFAWSFPPGVDFEVQVSQDPAFPAASVRAQTTEDLELEWEKPIPPGMWYWRVVSRTAKVESVARRFEQTAPAAADTAGPRLETWHHWLGQKPLELRYGDPGGIAAVRLTLDGQDVSKALQWGQATAVYSPPADWPEGLHQAHVELADRAGNVTRRDLWLSHTAPMPTVVWRPHGGVTIGGRPHFPLGLYQVQPEDMAKVAAGAFTMVHDYGWEGNKSTKAALAYLNAAEQAGLKVFMGLSREALMAADFAWVAKRVAGVMGHPALLAWYLFDEPGHGLEYCPPALLIAHRRLMKALDPFHPAIVDVPGVKLVKELYQPAFDVHWTASYESASRIANDLDTDRAAMTPDKALMGIVHCGARRVHGRMDAAALEPQGASEFLAREQFRPEAFMALAHDSSGLAWWWNGAEVDVGGGTNAGIVNLPAGWSALTGVVARVRSLEPALTAPGEARRWTAGPEGTTNVVHFWEKRHPGGTLILAVNRKSASCNVAFEPSTVPDGATLDVLWEDRTVPVRGGRVEDTFAPLGVHVYATSAAP